MDEGKAVDVIYLDFGKAFNSFPQNSVGETGCSWFGRVYSLLGKQLAGLKSAEGGGEWRYIQLAVGHEWLSLGLSFGASLV